MATSRFQNLRAAITTAITSRLTTDGVSGVTVTQYPPLGDYAREDRVFLTEIRSRQEPMTQGGTSGKRLEELEVDFIIQTPVHGGSVEEYADGETRAETILASVETAVRNDPTVSATVFNIELAEFTSSIQHLDEDGPYGWVEGTFEAEAHI